MTAKTHMGVILAAGRGSRMGELTSGAPKCLCVIAGRPMIEWQLAAMGLAGIKRIAIVTGYRREKIAPYAADGVELIENPVWAETNMVGSLMAAGELPRSGGCIVSYSDIVYHPRAVEALADADGDICVTYDTRWLELWRLRFADPLDDAETFREKDGWLTEIGGRPKSLDQIEGQYMGLLKLTPGGWITMSEALAAMTPERRKSIDMTSLLAHLLDLGAPVKAVPVHGGWAEVDSADDVAAYEKQIGAPTGFSHDWRW